MSKTTFAVLRAGIRMNVILVNVPSYQIAEVPRPKIVAMFR